MFDMHYDLLSIIYRDYLNNDFTFTKNWIKNYNEENVKGLIANLYFMSGEEMAEELHPNYWTETSSVVPMFEKSIEILTALTKDKKLNILYGIEGCDYIKDEQELTRLYQLGLRSICLVWNNQNQYGSGNRTENGLTKRGEQFIWKAISLGIALDLSHANEKTFYDIIKIIKEAKMLGVNPVVYASHSNSRILCNRDRNLKDEQLKALKSVDGYVGVMSNRNFITQNNSSLSDDVIRQNYIKHIDHIAKIIGYDHMTVSTDDMTFMSEIDYEYETLPIYNYSSIKNDLLCDLKKNYSTELCNDIMYENANKIYQKLKK